MKVIKEIVEKINDEIEGAESYAKAAIQYREEDKTLADTYIKLAEVELTHVDALHTQVVRIIKAWQAKGNEVPAPMQVLYDWEHGKQIDKVAKIRTLMSMYSGK